MPALTRGPLPARVYWVRRLVVLGIALLMVVGIARLLGGGSDASSGGGQAAQAAAEVTDSATAGSEESSYSRLPTLPTGSADSSAPAAGASPTPGRPGKHRSTASALAVPTGKCADDDVAVTPQVDHAVAGRDVRIVLQLQTMESEACTWQVSRNNLTVDITSGKDEIWTSRQCPHAVPNQAVVVRRDQATNVAMTWHGRRSDDTCSHYTDWAMPGWYHVTAAAVGGEPSDAQFQLTTPTPVTITKTAKPHQHKQHRDD